MIDIDYDLIVKNLDLVPRIKTMTKPRPQNKRRAYSKTEWLPAFEMMEKFGVCYKTLVANAHRRPATETEKRKYRIVDEKGNPVGNTIHYMYYIHTRENGIMN